MTSETSGVFYFSTQSVVSIRFNFFEVKLHLDDYK